MKGNELMIGDWVYFHNGTEIERLREIQPLDFFRPKESNKIDWLAGKLFTITSLEVFLYSF